MRAVLLLAALAPACKGPDTPQPTDDSEAEVLAPNIDINIESIDFGKTDDIGETVQELVVIQNIGQGTLTISEVTATAPFLTSVTAGTLIEVPPLQSVNLTVKFSPTEYTDSTGTLVLKSDDPDQPEITISLTGGVIVDADEDGVLRPEAGGLDCDDSDDQTYPDAPEIWYDGTDQDCKNDDDYDQDGDGYQASAYNEDVADGGGDCLDTNPEVRPGAADAFYDNIDSNCDGANDWDQDGDGYGASKYNKGKDCDDEDPDAYPEAPERLNGKLDDCSGDKDLNVTGGTADIIITGKSSGDQLGYSVEGGDMDGDGYDDIFVGSPGAGSGKGVVYVRWGDSTGPTSGVFSSQADITVTGSGSTDYFGSGMTWLDDSDGNGSPDIAVGSYGANSSGGAIYIFDATDFSGSPTTADAHTVIKGSSGSYYYVGKSGIAGGDINADGRSDLFFYYTPSTSSSSDDNYIGLVYGDSGGSGTVNASSADSRWATDGGLAGGEENTFEGLGNARDINGDGYDDFVFSDPWVDGDSTNDGAVWVLWGRTTAYSSTGSNFGSTAEKIINGGNYGRMGVVSVALNDINGDGYAEVAGWSYDQGDVAVVFGGPSVKGGGSHTLSATEDETDVRISYSSSNDPTQIRPTADWDSDGYADWIIGHDGASGSVPGRFYLFDGYGLSGTYTGDDAMGSVQASKDDDNKYLTHAIPHEPFDVDGDGKDDVVAGDYGYEGDVNADGSGDSTAGSVHVFLTP